MKKYTGFLFFISLFLSLTSMYVMEKGGKELYPFASWKLFSVPSGSLPLEDQYKFYRIEGRDTIRILHKETSAYGDYDISQIIGFYGSKIEKKENLQSNIKKLQIFAKDYLSNSQNVFLCKEIYNPWLLDKSSFKIKRVVITKL